MIFVKNINFMTKMSKHKIFKHNMKKKRMK